MIRLCFLACWILTFSTVALQSTRYALQGQMVAFEPVIETPPDEILWKHNGNKVVEFNGNEEIVYSPFQKRIILDWHAAALQIKQLRHSDSGEYELDVLTEKGFNRLFFKLEVIDRVAKPIIFCKMNNGSSSSDKSGNEATLMCSSDSKQSQPLTFEWSPHGETRRGPTLKILLGKEHDNEVYSCTVSNRLSNEMATFTAKDCYLVNRSTGLSAGLSATIGVLVSLCVLAILGVVCCKLKHKACFAKEKTNDVEQQSSLSKAHGHISDDTSEPLLDRKPTLPSNQRLQSLPGMTWKKNTKNYEGDTASDEDIGAGVVKRRAKKFERTQQPAESKKEEEDEDAPNMAPGDEHKEEQQDAITDQGTAETKKENEKEKAKSESDDLGEKKKSPPTDKQTDFKISKDVHAKPRPPVAKKTPFSRNFLQNTSKKEEDEDAPNITPANESKEEQQDANTNKVTTETKEENENEENASDDLGENIESPTTEEHTESKKMEDEDAPNMVLGDEHKEEQQDAITDQGTAETKKENEKEKAKSESDDLGEKKKSPPTDKQTDLEISKDVHAKPRPPVAKKTPFSRNFLQNKSKKEEDEDAPNITPADISKEEQQDADTNKVTAETKEENENEENASDVLGENIESPTTEEHTESKKEEDKESPNMAPADEHKEEQQDAITDQGTAETKKEKEKEKEENESFGLIANIKLSTTDEQTGLKSNKDKSKKTPPHVPKKSHSFKQIKGQAGVNAVRENKVSERDGLEEHSGATESDLQSSTSSETPGLESNKDKSKKTPPHVPKKSHSFKQIKGQAGVNAVRENKVSERDGLEEHSGATESDLQSSTSSQTPEFESEAVDKAKFASEVGGSPSAAIPCSPLTQVPPKIPPENDAGKHVDNSNSEQVSGETNDKNVGK